MKTVRYAWESGFGKSSGEPQLLRHRAGGVISVESLRLIDAVRVQRGRVLCSTLTYYSLVREKQKSLNGQYGVQGKYLTWATETDLCFNFHSAFITRTRLSAAKGYFFSRISWPSLQAVMVADKKELNGGNFRRSFQIPPIMACQRFPSP